MSRAKTSLDHKRIRRLIWLVLTVSVLLGYSLQSVAGNAYYSNELQNYVTVSSPPVILQKGTAGTSTIYTNNTSAKASVEAPLFDYADNNDPDVDSSVDKGTHSNFPAQQAGPDSTYDTLTEENTEAIEDYVDNISDVDSSPDIGKHSSFDNMKSKDDTYNILNETVLGDNGYSIDLTGGYITVATADLSIAQGTISFWVQFDSTTSGRPVGQNTDLEIRLGSNAIVFDWGGDNLMTSDNTFTTGTWYFIAFTWDENADDLFFYVGTETSAPTQDFNSQDGTYIGTVSTISQATVFWGNGYGASQPVDGHMDDIRFYNTVRTLSEILTDYNQTLNGDETGLVNYYKLENDYTDSAGTDDGSLSGSGAFDTDVPSWEAGGYDLDLEVQFTDVIDFLPTEKLCIYTGMLGSEDLRVDYWNGTGWENLATDLNAYSCNEYTVSLTSTAFDIRFRDESTEGDTIQDQWQIDASLLRVEGAGSKEDAVDQQSDVDSSTDVGTHSDFNAMKTKDGYNNLTEAMGVQQYTFFEDWESGFISGANWSTYSSHVDGRIVVDTDSPYGGSTYALWMEQQTNNNNLNELVTAYDFSGATEVILNFYHNEQGDENTAGSDHTNHLNSDAVYFTNNGNYWYHSVDLVDPSDWTYVEINITADPEFVSPANSSFAIKFAQFDNFYRPNDGRGFENINITYTTAGSSDYTMDLEVQWTDLPYLLPNEELCIYTGTMGTEDIKVDVWNGSSWENIVSNLNASAWNNVTVNSYLTSSNFTIRFKGGNETGDTSEDTWQIDVALIHVWHEGGEKYELDLEVQWTSTDYTQKNEELCIKTGTFSGSENIQVKVWNNTGSSWHWVMNLTASQWNNVSITSYLTSNTFTVQFLGGTETGDTTQDGWNIDATLLHVWTNVQAPTGWLSGWDKRVKITIDNNDVDSPLSNFPVLVHLSNSSGRNNDDATFVFDEVGSNSKKIAVTTSDGTQCYVEIERWDDVSEQAWLWVKVPSISNTTDTELYLYYDMDHADNTGYVGDTGSTAAQNVWDSSFKGVWHLSETSGGVGAIKDSTSNNNVGTGNGSPTFNATGRIDSAVSFDGIDDYINMSNSASLQFTSSLTIEAWINLESFGSGSDVDIVLRKGEGNPNDYQLAIHDQKLALMIVENDDAGLESTASLTATTWYYLAGTWNGSMRRVYLNGSEDGSGPKTGPISPPDARDIYIGGRLGTDLSTGVIDEVRASNTTRSVAWLKASYESERDDLLGFGSEETCGRAENYDFVLRVANQVANNWTINLQVYDSSNLARLSSATISFHDGNSSDQIIVSDGSITQSEGLPYNLAGNATIYISMSNLQATTNDLSYLYVHLKIQVPDTSTYMLYLITFEIT